jgi:hypothetical protein
MDISKWVSSATVICQVGMPPQVDIRILAHPEIVSLPKPEAPAK